MIKILRISISLILCLWVCNANITYADTWGWSYSDYNRGSYVPKRGSFSERVYRQGAWAWYESTVTFQLDQYNVDQILDYNNGGNNPGGRCQNSKAYLTIDMTHVPDITTTLSLDAQWIATNLPNAKLDIEDDFHDGEHEESEVTALGTVRTNMSYYMRTGWRDLRRCRGADQGNMQVQFLMSKKARFSNDYDNCTQSTAVQVINAYGPCQGNY